MNDVNKGKKPRQSRGFEPEPYSNPVADSKCTRRSWSPIEDDLVLHGPEKGFSDREIANALHRSVKSIANRRHRLVHGEKSKGVS